MNDLSTIAITYLIVWLGFSIGLFFLLNERNFYSIKLIETPEEGIPPVDLYLIPKKSIWKNQVRRTGFLDYFELDFYCLCSLQKSISKLILKFMFSKKATKIDEIFTVDLTLTT